MLHLIPPGDWRLTQGQATPTAPLPRQAGMLWAGSPTGSREWGEVLGGSQHHCKGDTKERSSREGAPSLSCLPSGLRKASRESKLSGCWRMNRSLVGGRKVSAWGSKHRGTEWGTNDQMHSCGGRDGMLRKSLICPERNIGLYLEDKGKMGRSLEDCKQREWRGQVGVSIKRLHGGYVCDFLKCLYLYTHRKISDLRILTLFFVPGSPWQPDEAFQLLLRIMFLNTLNKMHTKDHKGNHLYWNTVIKIWTMGKIVT